VQRYINGKIDDTTIFPTDPNGVSYADNPAFCTPLPETSPDWLGKRSGFPQNFFETCQTIFRQMFRVYAHLYWSHFEDMFCLNLEKAMNSCFSHFILTATTLNLLKKSDLEPMQPLIDLWARYLPSGHQGLRDRQSGGWSLSDSEGGRSSATAVNEFRHDLWNITSGSALISTVAALHISRRIHGYPTVQI
jgi:hypothetical protein